jgi:hypothetical protein
LTEEEQFLSNAADMLRKSIANFLYQPFPNLPHESDLYPPCDYFTSVFKIPNDSFIGLYRYIKNQSFLTLKQAQSVGDKDLKEALQQQCENFWNNERRSAPFSYATRHAAFLYDLAVVLNVPYFEHEVEKPQQKPEMIFAQKIWQNYKKNWEAIQPL